MPPLAWGQPLNEFTRNFIEAYRLMLEERARKEQERRNRTLEDILKMREAREAEKFALEKKREEMLDKPAWIYQEEVRGAPPTTDATPITRMGPTWRSLEAAHKAGIKYELPESAYEILGLKKPKEKTELSTKGKEWLEYNSIMASINDSVSREMANLNPNDPEYSNKVLEIQKKANHIQRALEKHFNISPYTEQKLMKHKGTGALKLFGLAPGEEIEPGWVPYEKEPAPSIHYEQGRAVVVHPERAVEGKPGAVNIFPYPLSESQQREAEYKKREEERKERASKESRASKIIQLYNSQVRDLFKYYGAEPPEMDENAPLSIQALLGTAKGKIPAESFDEFRERLSDIQNNYLPMIYGLLGLSVQKAPLPLGIKPEKKKKEIDVLPPDIGAKYWKK